MKPTVPVCAWLCLIAGGVLIGCSASSPAGEDASGSGPRTLEEYNASLPKDVHPDSRSRIPLIDRETLDEEGRKIYDEHVSPHSTSLAGIQGPGGLRLHGSRNPSERGVDRRLQELARLVVSREMDQVFEWGMHEPVALREGLEPEIIDVIRYRKPLTGVPEKEASIIQLGRELFQNHKVSSDTFARVLKHLGKKSLIDLCDFMGGYVNTAILLHTVDVHLPYDREPLLPVAGSASTRPRAKSLREYNASLPKDVHPDSRSRIPLIRREDLDEEGKRAYDARVSPDTTSLAGLQGPGGLGLHGSRNLSESGVDRRLQELARLVVSREMDQVFEWGMHEPVALKEGLEPQIIDVIRHRKPLAGVPEKEASIIQLGREVFQNRKVSSETFAKVLRQLGTKNLVDLCRFMGNYATTAILLHTVDLHLPHDREPRLPVS
jgi:4-carboxymuconolactone decarboxylase